MLMSMAAAAVASGEVMLQNQDDQQDQQHQQHKRGKPSEKSRAVLLKKRHELEAVVEMLLLEHQLTDCLVGRQELCARAPPTPICTMCRLAFSTRCT